MISPACRKAFRCPAIQSSSSDTPGKIRSGSPGSSRATTLPVYGCSGCTEAHGQLPTRSSILWSSARRGSCPVLVFPEHHEVPRRLPSLGVARSSSGVFFSSIMNAIHCSVQCRSPGGACISSTTVVRLRHRHARWLPQPSSRRRLTLQWLFRSRASPTTPWLVAPNFANNFLTLAL